MQDNRSIWIILLLLALVAGAAWWFLGQREPAEPPLPPPAAEPEARSTAPRYPVSPPAGSEEPQPALRPLPPLDESDEYFKLELTDLFGESVAGIIVSEALIERLVATVDNLPRPRVAERIRPVAAPDGQFAVNAGDGSGEYVLSTENYRRYDALVGRFVEADIGQAVEIYRRFYPLFQKAFEGARLSGRLFQRPACRGHRPPARDARCHATDRARSTARVVRVRRS
ncbi:MAG: DUF3014 domain-containing protein [Woeseiaceae bacterium]|nr:DUF3014 domain-containing protein [Woeseiaceae bacterium]